MAKVVLETGKNRRFMARASMEHLGDSLLRRVKAAKVIFVKPNLVHHERSLAVTHLDAVRGVLDYIREHSRARVIVGDGGMMGTAAAFRHFGYEQLPEEYEKVELVDLNEDEWVPGYSVREDGELNEVRRARTALEADLRISIAPLKTHASVGLSGAVESWVMGTWVVPSRISPVGRTWARWPWLESQGIKAHHASIARLFHDGPCDVALVDGVLAMQGDGPIEGEAIDAQVMIASTDPVAVDAVAATIAGIDPHEIAYLDLLQEQKDGMIDLTHIDIPPALLESVRRTFLVPVGLPERLRQAKQ
jgi:uncharacterized protein (DUF362 family)